MTLQPKNNLERSIMKAAEDPAHRPQFYRDPVESDLFIIEHGQLPEHSGAKVLREGYQLKIQNMDYEGKPFDCSAGHAARADGSRPEIVTTLVG